MKAAVFTSIRFKLTAWYMGLLAVILVLFGFLLHYFLSKRLYEGIDNSLAVSASVVAKAAAMNKSTPLPGLDRFLDQLLGRGNLNAFYRIYDDSGNVGQRFKHINPAQFPVTQKAYAKALKGETSYETFVLSDNQPIRMITMPVMRNNNLVNLVQVGTSLQAVNETMLNLRFFLFATVPATLAITTLVGYFLARRALKPLSKITQTAREIGSGVDVSKRLPVPETQDEIGKLAVTFNDMMERLENAFRQMRQFGSDASHELRTPLTVLKGQSELALGKERTSLEYQEVICSNLEEIDYMSRVLDDLFFLSKADEARIIIERKPLDLGPIIEEICKTAEIFANEKGIEVVIAYLEPVRIDGDAVRLRQMIWNLLHNAIKYTPEGGKVKVSLYNKEDCGLFAVEDSGIGIPEEHLPLIFNRFYRVDKARAKNEGGSGLGLSICKYIVEAHNGQIEVESKVGMGTKFRIRLPKAKSPKPLDA